jgi:xylan 1,4-beta-xylosidase
VKATRREALGTLLGAGVSVAGSAIGAVAPAAATAPAQPAAPGCAGHGSHDWSHLRWAAGFEGQRKPDLGDGTFLNPLISGDHPDPSILRDGSNYYLTFSSFDAYPGLPVWRSTDLVNWQPMGSTLNKPVGSVWAPELVKHGKLFYNYFHARTPRYRSLYVITAQDMAGPWSDPVDLKLHAHIDPGHAVGEDGKRYLFLSNGDRVRLTDDGLATDGAVEHVYDPWRYPPEWNVETFAPEGPKVLRRGEWFYLILAVGGTAGPPTGHMVIVARSRSIHGPWENAPNNPMIRTTSAGEKWWSRGHATAFEAPDGSWWMVYHGYENGFWTLGRQTLLDPLHWTAEGWLVADGGDLSRPIAKPGLVKPPQSKAAQAKPAAKDATAPVPHGAPLSDDFSGKSLAQQWSFYDPGPDESRRLRFEPGALVVTGKGSEPRDCSPLTFLAGELAYQFEVDVEVQGDAHAGVLLYYNRRLYCGLGFDARRFTMHRYGLERTRARAAGSSRKLRLRVTNDRHIVSFHWSDPAATDGVTWNKYDVQMEVSGYHHNVAGDFLSLRPGIYVAGAGEARFANLRFRAL